MTETEKRELEELGKKASGSLDRLLLSAKENDSIKKKLKEFSEEQEEIERRVSLIFSEVNNDG